VSGSIVQKKVFGFRYVDTLRGESLQILAARELGDGTLWATVAAFNSLKPPYITDDPSAVRPGVVLSGTQLRVPAPVAFVSVDLDPTEVLLTDIRLTKGRLTVGLRGDLDTVSGADNLKQALVNRIETNKGELVMHAGYGSDVRRIVGTGNGPTAGLLGAQYAKTAVAADTRISKVLKTTSKVNGDIITVVVDAETISGRQIQVVASP
jgi:phage baseplate assembly protein W